MQFVRPSQVSCRCFPRQRQGIILQTLQSYFPKTIGWLKRLPINALTKSTVIGRDMTASWSPDWTLSICHCSSQFGFRFELLSDCFPPVWREDHSRIHFSLVAAEQGQGRGSELPSCYCPGREGGESKENSKGDTQSHSLGQSATADPRAADMSAPKSKRSRSGATPAVGASAASSCAAMAGGGTATALVGATEMESGCIACGWSNHSHRACVLVGARRFSPLAATVGSGQGHDGRGGDHSASAGVGLA